MAINLIIPAQDAIHPVPGIRIGTAEAGIRKAGRRDLTVLLLDEGTAVAGVFTRNRFRAAPVQVCEAHLATGGGIRALVINTGNANAGTGEPGLQAAHETCRALAGRLGVAPEQILPFSTGVILEPLPVDRLIAALPAALDDARPDHWFQAAHSIMTTDTQPKIHSIRVDLNGTPVTVTGISKGAGIIRPNMATMLGFLGTDAGLPLALLRDLAQRIADQSFNRITVDGDTSTNDSFILIATGASGARIESEQDPRYAALAEALTAAARDLAQKIVRDAEGATKFMTIRIEQAASTDEALKIAYAIAHSPLVKTAFYASDPNLGRILAAIGYAGVDDLDVSKLTLWLGDVRVASQGGRDPGYREEDGQRVMAEPENPGARRPGARRGGRHGVHLRFLARVRQHQRGLSILILGFTPD